MKTKHNILTKIFLILLIAAGWGSSAWAVTAIQSSPAPADGKFAAGTHWYYIVFRGNTGNAGTYCNVDQNENGELKWGSTSTDEGAYWCFVGDNTSGFKMYNLKSGPTMVLEAVGTNSTAHIKMVLATSATDDRSLWTTGAMEASGKTQYNYIRRGLTGQSGFNDTSGFIAMFTHGSNLAAGPNFAMEIIEAPALAELNSVNLAFKDAGDNTLDDASVTYTPSNGDPAVTLDATRSPYDFEGEVYSPTLFSATSDYTLGKVSYDDESNTLTFILSPHVLPTGVYRMVASKDDRGFFIDVDTYLAVAKNRHQQSWAPPTDANSLWYIYNVGGNKYYISSLSSKASRGADHVAFLKGTGTNTSFELDTPTEWLVDYNSTATRFSSNHSGYDTTIPTPDYFTVKLTDAKLLKSTPGYSGANSCTLASYEAGASDIEFQPYAESLITDPDQQALLALTKAMWATELLDGPVTLKFVDENNKPTTITNVTYHPSNGSADVVLEATETSYTFDNEQYADYLAGSLFTISKEGYNLKTSYDSGAKTLTFKISADPNLLLFSDAPVNGAWAENTKWFTWRNNRSGTEGQSNPPYRYLSTTSMGVDNNYHFSNRFSVAQGNDGNADRGGKWCFVGDNEHGFQIQNAAYGPDFVFAYLGSNDFGMVLKDEAPATAVTTFTFGEASAAGITSQLDGANYGYVFRIGTTGNDQLHSNNNGFISWNGGTPNRLRYDDGGSVFKVTAVSDADLEALQAYDVYRVSIVGNPGYTSMDYNNQETTFGRRSTPNDGAFMIVKKNTAFAPADFTAQPSSEYEVIAVETTEDATHYHKHLAIEVHDLLATDAYTIIVANGTADDAYDVDALNVYYNGAHHKNGQTIYARPTVPPTALNFVLTGADDKFIWGPVIDKKAKTVTFDIRDKATEFHTGLYQLMLKDQNTIDAVNGYISMFDENLNTASNYLYLAPTVYKNQGAQMKFTGVPTYADEPSTYIYIEEKTGNTVDISTAGRTKMTGLPYSFANGEITFTGYSYPEYSNYEPKEQPAFQSKGGANTTFVLHPVSMEAYDAYTLVFDGNYTSSTTVRYSKTTPTGVSVYGNGDMFVVNNGYTSFLPEHFAPSDARCVSVVIESAPTETELGRIKLTLSLPVREFTVKITGDAKNLATDRVVYNGVEYENDATVNIAGATVDPTSIKTNVTDRFVWGPIIDEDFRTVTFDIRPLATDIEDGWYQIQLLGDDKIADANYRITQDNGNINSVGSYIYVLPMYNNTNSVLGKYGGVPTYSGEGSSYFRITRDGTSIRIQSPDGRYAQSDGALEYGKTEPTSISAWRFINGNKFQVARWTAPDLWQSTPGSTSMGKNAGNQGPIVASGSGYLQEHFITKVDPTALYDVYQVNLTETGETKVKYTGAGNEGNSFVYNNGYFFLAKGTDVPTKEQFRFEGSTKIVESIAIDANNVITFTLKSPADGYTNTIIHRQHAVYDLLEATDPSLRPGTNHIQAGEGMIEHPKVENPDYDPGQPESPTNRQYLTNDFEGNDLNIQNTATYYVTQYVKRGGQTVCLLPFTRGNSGNGYMRNYQRVYDFLTEEPLDDDIIGTGLNSYRKVSNGHYSVTNGKTQNGENVSGFTDPTSRHIFTLPVDKDEVYIGFDSSAFRDFDVTYDDHGNILEPSLSSRVVFHLIAADKMALKPEGSNDFFESETFCVANVKRGRDEHGNNLDLIPLSMPYTNYWFPATPGGTDLMPVAPYDATDLNSVVANIDVVVEGTASDGQPMTNYIAAGVFTSYPGAKDDAQPKFPFIDHYIYYKYLGDGFKRVVPANSQAVIKVYAKNGSATQRYELAKFTLEFLPDAEPLAITSVVGNPNSTRSEDYFIKNHYSQVASLTFENKDVAFNDVNVNKTGEPDVTYAFPIDFSRTSYAYNSSWEFGTYAVLRTAYASKFQPVALYEKNIKDPTSMQTSMTDDYLFYIDAAEQPGQVASVALDGTLCAGSRLYCYGWLASSNSSDVAGASVVLRMLGVDSDGKKHVVASYLSGQLSDVAYDEDGTPMRSLAYGRTPSWNEAKPKGDAGTLFGPWQQVGSSFTVESNGYVSYELQIINNAYSTAGGDYVLDDFKVYVAPPKPRVEFIAPVCYDEVPHLKVVLPRESIGSSENIDTDGFTDVCYCFLDKEKYYGKLEELDNAGKASNPAYTNTVDDYNAAFYYALIGNKTAADVTDSDGNVDTFRSFWNMKAAFTDAAYNSYKEYDFAKIFGGDYLDSYPRTGVYRQSSGAVKEIVFSTEIAGAEGWEDNRDYIIAFTQSSVTEHFETAGCSKFNVEHSECLSLDEFTMSPSLTINSDLPELTVVPASACDGQVSTISVDMHGYGPNHSVVLKNMAYDWWVGYGKLNDTDPVQKADVHNFEQQRWPDDESGVYLRDALEHFRALYPDAFEAESSEPKTGEVAGQPVVYTQADKDCILHFLEPGANGRVPLILGSRILNVSTNETDAVIEDGHKYIYFTVLPIRPDEAYDADENVIFCPEPQQGKILVDQYAPKMIDGFTGMHGMYPESMTNVPIRMGLRQIDAVRLNAVGNMGDYHLRVPLRGVAKAPANRDNASTFIGKRKRNKVSESDTQSFDDFLTLVYTDDPLYFDRMIQDVDEFGNMQLITVGRVEAYNAPTTGDAHMEIGFARDFRPREGYVYTLKAFFEEDVDADPTAYKPCPGSLVFDLKVVPEYAQWTAAEGNTDWTNDGNWARADRDVLHADNATSEQVTKGDALHPFNGYQTNTANYSGDARYKVADDASAHVFVPMYFTNVLMHDAELSAPAIYTHQAPVAGTRFLGDLKPETATKLIEYDMLATPISESGSWASGATMTPLALADRYGKYDCNFGCELFWSNVCDGLTFEPGTAMYDAQYLSYNKAWVEYKLKTGRWYTLASPLQDTYAGEWYSPEAGGRQLTPHFAPITYSEALNDRFNPAYYQRSWDKAGEAWIYRMNGDEGTYVGFEHDRHADNVRVQKPIYLNWSYVYNDVTVPYSNGGFSVNVRYTDQGTDATDGKALVRMPKDDASYLYYQSEASAAVGNTNGQNPDGSNTDAGVARPNGVASGDYTQITRSTATHHRLMSDMLRSGSTINQSIVNASASNPYYLIGNPLMAPLDMEKFFQQNTQFVDHAEKVKNDDGSPALGQDGAPLETHDGLKYWIMSDGLQEVSMKVNGNWISTNGSDGVVAPLQGFFVRVASDDEGKATATFPNGMQVKYTAEMQKKDFTADVPAPSLRAPRRSDAQPGIFRITATNGSELESNAVVYFSEQASNRYNTAEDAETLLDGNIADKVSTVFTAAATKDAEQPLQALSINSMSTSVSMIPVGVVAPKDDTRTTLTFSGISTLEAVMDGTPHLYDADNDTFTVLDEDTAITVTGTSAGRYFIVCGTKLPFVDEEAAADEETNAQLYNLNGVRIATPQHGTVNIRGSRKEYNK